MLGLIAAGMDVIRPINIVVNIIFGVQACAGIKKSPVPKEMGAGDFAISGRASESPVRNYGWA